MRISDWSSDVCSSDLQVGEPVVAQQAVSLSAVHRESDEASARHPRPLVMQAGIGHRASWRRGLIPFSFQLSAGSISRNSSESAKSGVSNKVAQCARSAYQTALPVAALASSDPPRPLPKLGIANVG